MNNQSSAHLMGIDLGGSSIKAVVVTPDGALLKEANTPFTTETAMDWAKTLRGLARSLQNTLGHPIRHIGLSAPGLASPDGHSIAYMPGRLEGLVGLNWRDYLEVEHPVPVLNDAHAALLGESWLGAAREFRNVILLTLGTGVGGAAMVDGRLLRGHTGKAGHLGHVCLDTAAPSDICGIPGSLEEAIGNCTIERRTGGRFQSTHELIAAHRSGDPEATVVWNRSLHALACAIGSFTNILDPEALILGGGIARAGDDLFVPLRDRVSSVEWKVCGHHVRILPAQLGELAGAYGAARNALDSSIPSSPI